MVQADTTTDFDAASPDLSQDDSTVLTTIADRLNTEPDTLEVYEGSMTGALYVAVSDGFQTATVSAGGLEVSHVTQPQIDEELDPVVQIEPDEGETVHDAVDNLAFSGD